MTKKIIKPNWRKNAEQILSNHPDKSKILNTLFAVLGQIERNDWKGACHATCSVIHVLLSEQGIQSNLVLGEAKKGVAFFNHSWIEISNEVYDVAIAHSLVPQYSNPPTIKGHDIDTTQLTAVEYGVNSGLPDDMPTVMVKQLSLSSYFANFPGHPTLGLWVAVLDAAHQLGLKLDVKQLQSKYDTTFWTER